MEEEHGGEDGLLAEARNDKGKLTAKGRERPAQSHQGRPGAADEKQVLQQYAALADQEATASKRVKGSPEKRWTPKWLPVRPLTRPS
jgi:type I restriction enzyme M protein